MKIYFDSITKEKIKIDKTIYVFITPEDFLKCVDSKLGNTALTLSEFQNSIKAELPEIYTTMTCAISSRYFVKGYDIIIISEGKQISFYDDIMNNPDCALTYGKEIRLAHNWEKMFHSGCFDIKCNWE